MSELNKEQKQVKAAQALAEAAPGMGAVERAVALGDLSRLSNEERMVYYSNVCVSLDLNPLTQPFEYIVLDGKLKLYARKDCCDQLRNLRSITIEIVSQQVTEDLALIHVRAIMPAGKSKRTDEDLGVVSLTGLKAQARANAVMKAITKAKRRVTLSICGLGFLDETEVVDVGGGAVPQLEHRPAAPALPASDAVEVLASDQQRKEIGELCEACGVGDEEYVARLPTICGQADPAKLTAVQAEKVLKALRVRRDKVNELRAKLEEQKQKLANQAEQVRT